VVTGGGDPSCPAAGHCTSTVNTPVTTTAQSADLAVIKTGLATVVAGNNVVYTITVTNRGPDPAVNSILNDPTPAGTTFVSSGAPCSAFPCNLGTLASGQSVVISSVTFLVPANYSATSVVNVASTSSDTPDPTPNNNGSTVGTTVTAAAQVPVPVPVNALWMLLTLGVLLCLVGAYATQVTRV